MNWTGQLLASAGALALSACATVSAPAPERAPAFAGQTWQLLQINRGGGNKINLSLQQQARHTITFNADKTVSMSLDCNRGNGRWSSYSTSYGNGELTISQIASTRALCPPPSYGEEMAADLPTATGYTLLPDGKSMTIITGRSVYALVAAGYATQLPGDTSGSATQLPGDALVPGTNYHATAQVLCSFNSMPPTRRCQAGVKRNWNGAGKAVVEITRPNGLKRAIFFEGTKAISADSAQADGSAAYSFNTNRRGDETIVAYGPERYVIPDAFVVGG